MIWHGIYKQLVQVFIENISNQLFFAIFVNAEKNLFCLEVLLEYFSAAFFRFFAPVEYYDPRKKGLFHPYSDT